MFDAIPFGQVGYSGRFAAFTLFARRIFTAVYSAAEFLWPRSAPPPQTILESSR
jgi:hypothetical protein